MAVVENNAVLREIAIGEITEHPQNPSVQSGVWRDDVVERICEWLKESGAYPQEHAVRVRPFEGKYQLVAGHHRMRAAREAGIDTVWAWVRDMDDDEAFMALALDNEHGEWTPLHYGLHALASVELGKGGAGRKGGLREYARQVGRAQPTVTEWVQAARVATITDRLTYQLFDLTTHLAAIHAAPQELWPVFVEALLAQDWTVADTKAAVKKVIEVVENINPTIQKLFMAPELICNKILNKSKTANQVIELERLAVELLDISRKIDEIRGTNEQSHAITEWLTTERDGKSWDKKSLHEQVDNLRAVYMRDTANETEQYRIIEGDLKSVGSEVADDSVDWIITDPPYPAEYLNCFTVLGEFAARVLKPGGSLICMVGQSYLPAIMERLMESLEYHWVLAYLTPGGQAVQLWDRNVNTFWKPLLWLTKGEYRGDWIGDVCKSAVNDNDKQFHDWGQSESGMRDIVERFTRQCDVICDPFCGGGTTGRVSVETGRQFIGIDIDAESIKTTRKRCAEACGRK